MAVGVDFATASPSFASGPPTSPTAVVEYARRYLGLKLAGVKNPAVSPEVPDGPWNSPPYEAAWCAWFASWCLRGTNPMGKRTDAGGFTFLERVTTPVVGDLVVFNGGSHVAIVTQVDGGLRSIDGNRGTWGYANNVVKESTFIPHTSKEYRRPVYTPTAPTYQQGGADMLMIMKGTGPNYTFALFAPGFWYEWTGNGAGAANDFSMQISGGATGAVRVDATQFDAIKAEAQRPIEVVTVSP